MHFNLNLRLVRILFFLMFFGFMTSPARGSDDSSYPWKYGICTDGIISFSKISTPKKERIVSTSRNIGIYGEYKFCLPVGIQLAICYGRYSSYQYYEDKNYDSAEKVAVQKTERRGLSMPCLLRWYPAQGRQFYILGGILTFVALRQKEATQSCKHTNNIPNIAEFTKNTATCPVTKRCTIRGLVGLGYEFKIGIFLGLQAIVGSDAGGGSQLGYNFSSLFQD